MRFDDRLSVAWEIEPRCERALVPSMILQPLIENAIKYAISKLSKNGTITITAHIFGSDLLIDVADNGPGAEIKNGKLAREHGVGLPNIRERLQSLYGKNFSFVITNNQPNGLRVSLRIPYELKEVEHDE